MQPFGWLLSGWSVDDETIFRKNSGDLIRYAAALVGPVEAEDVVSVVVLRILERKRLQDLDDARPYMFRAVLNECKTRLVRRRTRLAASEITEVAGPHSGTDPHPEVTAAVLALPPQQRAATYLVYWADMSILEAATLMGVRPGTVKRYLHLARRRIKGVLDDY